MSAGLAGRLQEALAQTGRISLTLEQADFRAKINSDDMRTLAWTQWFFRPWFARTAEEASCEFSLLRDDSLFAQLNQFKAQESGGEIYPCVQHTHKHGFSQHWTFGDLRLLYDVEFDTYCVVQRLPVKILVLAAKDNIRAASTLMRAVRELACLEHIRRRGVILHAAAMAQEGATLAVAPKRGGKTTFLLRSLLEGSGLIANDRVALLPSDGGVQTFGIPTVTPLREGTLELFPAIQQELNEHRFHFRRRPRAPGKSGKWNLSPIQLCALTGAKPISAAPAQRFLFLVKGTGIPRQLSPNEAGLLFAQEVFDFSDTERHFFAGLFPVEEFASQDSLQRLFRRLAESAEFWQYPREGRG